jgi:DNA-binding response OmpR family regulator
MRTILLVEDEEMIKSLAARMLRLQGYTVSGSTARRRSFG